MKYLKNNLNVIVFCLFEIIVGVLLLISPVGFTTGIIAALGVLLMAVGALSAVKYFRAEPREAERGQYLTKGLLALLAGGFCAFRSHWFIVTFPALSILYGVAVLVAGLAKVQYAFDMLRQKNKRWFLALIAAVISIVCAIVVLGNPFATASVLWMFTGISLIVEALVDAAALIASSRGK